MILACEKPAKKKRLKIKRNESLFIWERIWTGKN